MACFCEMAREWILDREYRYGDKILAARVLIDGRPPPRWDCLYKTAREFPSIQNRHR